MTRTITRNAFLGLLMAVIVLPSVNLGCNRDSNKPKFVQPRKGRVSAINRETGEVKMVLYLPKQKKEQEITGKLDPHVEIFINGALAKVEDVKIDDTVQVLGRITGSGPDAQFVATRVEVERPTTEIIPPASAPASSPAAAPK